MRFGKSKEEALAEPGRGGDFIRYLKDDPVTMRILQEQDEWKYYWEHYNSAVGSYPCSQEEDCPGCTSKNEREAKPSRKIAFNALTSFNGVEYVNAWKVGPMVADKLENRIKRNDTITDRDYTISRYKTGNDRWDFEVEGSPPSPVDLHKSDWKDIEEMLQRAWNDVWGDPERAQANRQAADNAADAGPRRATIAPQKAPVQPEEPPFEEKVYQEADLRALDYEVLLKTIKDDMSIEPPASVDHTSDAVVDWLMEIQK